MEILSLFAQIETSALIDIVIFVGFLIAVVTIGITMSRGGEGSESYFLAGRGLAWWLIGFSLIAANISTEQFVGMSGSAANYVGLAIASYEWMAAVTLVIVGFLFLPQFLKSGIYTIPEFLEKRYNKFSRTVMSIIMMATFVTVNTTAVIYSGAKVYATYFAGREVANIPLNIYTFSWLIGILAATYVFFGGLKACAWADLIQGSALILGGAIVLFFAMQALGEADIAKLEGARTAVVNQMEAEGIQGAERIPSAEELSNEGTWSRFTALNSFKLRMNLPWNDAFVPITALMLGLWIPNLYYWGLNQYIMQRTLGSKSLAEGQKGIVFAAFMKLIIPFIVVFPGIIAFNMFSENMTGKTDPHRTSEIRKSEINKNNDSILAKFEKEKANTNSTTVFPFVQGFIQVHPEKAGEIIQHNARVARCELKTGTLKEQYAQVMDAVKAENKDKATATITQAKPLMGYDYDMAFPLLMSELNVPSGLRGFMLAAILGAVISSLASMLNAASTIFSMDLYKEYINRQSSDASLVWVGRVCVIVFTLAACVIAPFLGHPALGGIFNFIQEFQGFISPGILAVFIFGFISKRAPAACGPTALLMSPAVYGLLKWVFLPEVAFLDRMAITFASVLIVLTILRFVMPRSTPYENVSETKLEIKTSKGALIGGIVVLILTAILYLYFWDYSTPMFPQ